MRYLLDTQAFIWMDNQPENLSASVSSLFSSPDNDLFVSLTTIWEMQIKSQLGKVKLRLALPDLIQEQINNNALTLLSIELNHLFALASLEHHHRDPFDRLLIAQARVENLTIITNDPQIHKYAVATVW